MDPNSIQLIQVVHPFWFGFWFTVGASVIGLIAAVPVLVIGLVVALLKG